jgi:hypothetical protein
MEATLPDAILKKTFDCKQLAGLLGHPSAIRSEFQPVGVGLPENP